MTKLIRDKIPEILKSKRIAYSIRKASEEEYRNKLKEKLKEEVNEYLKDENKEELADIQEVLLAIYRLNKYTKQEIEKIRQKKAMEKGQFKKRILLDQ